MPSTDHLPLHGRRVLVVEDDADTRALLLVVLNRAGASVNGVASAAEAFEAIQSWSPDALVSDIGMPEEDGYSLMRRVRAAGYKMPAVALTAYHDRHAALEVGYDAHMGKPIDFERLLRILEMLRAEILP